jgi:hypothetical protein
MSQLNAGFPEWTYGAVCGWAIGREEAEVPAVIFGVQSLPNRALGFHVALEGGALYSVVPIHALRHGHARPEQQPVITSRQPWDSFGIDMALTTYPYLKEQAFHVPALDLEGRYWTTLQHFNDGYSQSAEQTKAFHLLKLEDGTFGAYPNNHLRLLDFSFNEDAELLVPRRQTRLWYAEGQEDA